MRPQDIPGIIYNDRQDIRLRNSGLRAFSPLALQAASSCESFLSKKLAECDGNRSKDASRSSSDGSRRFLNSKSHQLRDITLWDGCVYLYRDSVEGEATQPFRYSDHESHNLIKAFGDFRNDVRFRLWYITNPARVPFGEGIKTPQGTSKFIRDAILSAALVDAGSAGVDAPNAGIEDGVMGIDIGIGDFLDF